MSGHPENLLVAWSGDIAKQYAEAFGLNLNEWGVAGVGEARIGRRYQRIVLLRPHWNMCVADAIEFEFQTERWRTALGPSGYFKVI